MTDGEIIGEATDHDSLVALLRKRKMALQLSDAVVDELTGLAHGYCNKVLGVVPVRTLGHLSLTALLAVLAVKLVVIEDPEQAAKIGKRWVRRDENSVRPVLLTIRQARPVILSRLARQAARARWAGKSVEERRAVLAQVRAAKAARRCAGTEGDAA
jgi:hypothetical protein